MGNSCSTNSAEERSTEEKPVVKNDLIVHLENKLCRVLKGEKVSYIDMENPKIALAQKQLEQEYGIQDIRDDQRSYQFHDISIILELANSGLGPLTINSKSFWNMSLEEIIEGIHNGVFLEIGSPEEVLLGPEEGAECGKEPPETSYLVPHEGREESWPGSDSNPENSEEYPGDTPPLGDTFDPC